jgi:signal transduction histidine kinase/CheY-like chemotaxis protein
MTTLYRLQNQLGVAVGTVIMCLALGLAVILWKAAERETLQLSGQNLDNLSAQIARELSEGMDEFGRAVLDQSLRDRFTSDQSTPEGMRSALDQFKQSHPHFAYASVVDIATGRVIAATGGVFEGGSGAGRPTFEEGKAGLYLGDVHEAVRLAELLPKNANGEPLRFLDAAAPILGADGKAFRVLATHIGWQWTQAVHDKVAGPLKDRRGVEIFLLDTRSKVVLSSSPRIPVGTDLSPLVRGVPIDPATVTWPDQGDYLTTVVETLPEGRFKGFGWKVLARQPLAVALASANEVRSAFLAGALALGLAAAAIAWFVAGRLVRPVRMLAEEASRAGAAGDWTAIPSSSGSQSLSDVQRAILQLTDSARGQAKAAHSMEQQFDVLAASLPQVVWLADAAGRMLYVNKEWVRARSGGEEFFVRDLEHVIFHEDCAGFSQAWERSLRDGVDLKVSCRLTTAEGAEPRWYDLEAHAVKDASGRPERWVGTIFDVHESVTLSEQMAKALEEERSARSEAERSARMRDEFLSTVSHELRSPLSAITGWSDILVRKANADETLAKAAAVIKRNALLQARLIEDLLDMSAVMAGKLTLNRAPFDLVALAKDVALSHLHAAQHKGIALVSVDGSPVMVDADSKRIFQVLSNLVGNALKFTDAGGRVEISTGKDDECARVHVRDTGRGISASFLPHVFDRLRQEDSSRTRRAGGLGLGLAIARAVVELHDGEISARSPGLGEGSTFSLTLPLAQDAVITGPAALEEGDVDTVIDLAGARILLVDDEVDAREVAQVALSSLGAQVRTASSAQEALSLLDAEAIDVLVSDIGMPEVDGLTLIRKVRARPPERGGLIPAVALTAFAMEAERQAGLAAGFQAYVTKPISLIRLSAAIAEARAQYEAPRIS